MIVIVEFTLSYLVQVVAILVVVAGIGFWFKTSSGGQKRKKIGKNSKARRAPKKKK